MTKGDKRGQNLRKKGSGKAGRSSAEPIGTKRDQKGPSFFEDRLAQKLKAIFKLKIFNFFKNFLKKIFGRKIAKNRPFWAEP